MALKFKTHISGGEFRKAEVKNPARKTELEKLAESVEEDDNHLLNSYYSKKVTIKPVADSLGAATNLKLTLRYTENHRVPQRSLV